MNKYLSWVEINQRALISNLKTLRRVIGPRCKLLVTIKSNAYGHGLVEVAKIASKNGADFFGVNSVAEADILRHKGINKPILIMGYTPISDLPRIAKLKVSLIVYNPETIKALGKIKKPISVHIKLETGINRQGVMPGQLLSFIRLIKQYPNIKLEGLYTHFANIENLKDPSYAKKQLAIFNQVILNLKKSGINIPIKHAGRSTAALLFPETHFDMIRPGTAVYGLWNSPEVLKTAQKKHPGISLQPVLTWKSIIAQIKEIPAGSYVGYGCTRKTTRLTKLAIIPVGYWDGFDRGFDHSRVLINGQFAYIFGRVCMNMIMVDATDIKNIHLEDEVVLLGQQKNQTITAEELAAQIKTINYEIVTRINPQLPRIIV